MWPLPYWLPNEPKYALIEEDARNHIKGPSIFRVPSVIEGIYRLIQEHTLNRKKGPSMI